MKPRSDDLDLYRENVYKSWQIMYEVVRQIDQECYIAHLEPFQGVEYDCLSLVTRNSHGNLGTSFMLNRNGVNGLCDGQLIENVWRRASTEDQVLSIANQLIDVAQLSRNLSGDSQSKMAQISKFIVLWISEHRDEEFCVSPPHWPQGCQVFRNQNFEPLNKDEWQIEDHLPWLILGVNYQEMVRIDMTNNKPTTQNGENVYTEAEKKRKKFGTNYLAAIDAWGGFKEEPAVIKKVDEIVKFTENELGPVSLVYVVDSGQYVAIRFTKDPVLGIVFINRGFVDHRIEIPGSFWNKTHDVWRTELPTSKNSAATHKKLPEIKQTLCTKCQMHYPANLSNCPTCTDA